MRIHRLTLRNFRCFEHLELDLHERMTLLVGSNGAGKSAILDALAIALGARLAAMPEVAREDRTLTVSDARLVRQRGGGLATINPTFPVQVTVDAQLYHVNVASLDDLKRIEPHEISYAPTPTRWTRELARIGGRTSTSDAGLMRAHVGFEDASASLFEEISLPLIAYYGTGRLWVQKRDKAKNAKSRSRMDGYTACLDFASSHKLFERWMADREGARLQQLEAAEAAGTDLASVRAPHLEAVQKAVCACLEGARRFYYSMNHQELRVEFDDERDIPFSSLSDGQRSLVVLAADIAWRAAQLNPIYAADAPRLTKGVVLIDEIELHLHPQWQRSVVPNLLRIFENIQFVMTTHSPQVVSTARPEWLRIIHADGTWHGVEHTFGRDSNALLRDVFDTPDRLRSVRARIDEVEHLLAEGQLDSARAKLTELERDLGPTDEVVTGLQWEILDTETHGADTEADA